jgi:hypothetical protein
MFGRIALTAVFVAFSFLLLVPAGTACARYPRPSYTITLEDEWGRALDGYEHGGRIYVLGDYGERYNIRVRNRTGRRVEAVVSVDGRDVISGDVADYTKHRGYVLAPYGSVLIEGFRRSLSSVAAFRFTNPSDSYSSRRGTPQHVGVIGAAFFPERRYRPLPVPRPLVAPEPGPFGRRGTGRHRAGAEAGEDRAASAPPAARSRAKGRSAGESLAGSSEMEMDELGTYHAPRRESRHNLGTRYGERQRSRAREVRFVRANRRHPGRVLRLYYDDAEGLLARGIDVHERPGRRPYAGHRPQAFPRNRFAPPPP